MLSQILNEEILERQKFLSDTFYVRRPEIG